MIYDSEYLTSQVYEVELLIEHIFLPVFRLYPYEFIDDSEYFSKYFEYFAYVFLYARIKPS